MFYLYSLQASRKKIQIINNLLHFVVVVVLCGASIACAQESVTLAWDAPTQNTDGSSLTDLAGYRLYRGTSAGSYDTDYAINNKDAVEYVVTGLASSTTYYFAIRAVNEADVHSDFSNEVSYTTAGSSNSSSSSSSSSSSASGNSDLDGDGLTYDEEIALGTDPNSGDTDRDAVTDGQEVTDGTNPSDKGSAVQTIGTSICAEWNGFLGLANIFEHVNLSSDLRNVTLTLYSITGEAMNTVKFKILPGAQFDALVHDLSGHIENSYGKVCSVHDGQPGDVDGRMVYYRQDPNGSGEFQFAFAMPMSNGVKGSQFVGFNTYQPSLASEDANNLPANWLQLTNTSATQQTGKLIAYNIDGAVIDEWDITITGGARRDFPLHEFGRSLVGLVEWRPDNSDVAFLVRNVRYMYDNAGSVNSFDTAFFLEGSVGTGELRAVPLDTANASAIVELSNALNEEIKVQVTVYSATGELRKDMSVKIPAYGTRHIITDDILNSEQGIATIKGNKANSVIAYGMQYGRTANRGIQYMYGVQAAEPVSNTLIGSYNTYLGQDSRLVLVNIGAETQTQNITLTRSDGTAVASANNELSVPANGVVVTSLSEEANRYGVVSVASQSEGTTVAWLIRVLPTADGQGVASVIPTLLR